MKDYKRLTEKRETPLVMSQWSGTSQELKIYNRLAELENKIEDGSLRFLPCKVGDKVYCIYQFYDCEEDFEYEIIPEEVVDIIVKEDDFDIGTVCRMIGKFKRLCVCLTKAEAEKKLEELKKQGERK